MTQDADALQFFMNIFALVSLWVSVAYLWFGEPRRGGGTVSRSFAKE